MLGYLDIQHLSFASRDKEHDVEGVIAKQLSIDLSRLVLFVFVGYLLPGLASAKRLWSNIAALTISLSSHIAMELLAFQTYVILSRNDNNGVSPWETYESEILKSWIAARVCQPEYVLEGLCRVQTKPSCEQEFNKYKLTLKRLCGLKEDPKSLWVANENSFKEIKAQIYKGRNDGKYCKELITVIRNKPGGGYVQRVQELLEPLESVKQYFPLLKNSFRRITARSLLLIISELRSDQDKRSISEEDKRSISEEDNKFIENAKTAYRRAKKLMDFVDCPDGVGINVDVLRTKNVEAFEVRSGLGVYKKMKFMDFLHTRNVGDTIQVDDALDFIRTLQAGAVEQLKGTELLEEEPNAEVLNTDWTAAAKYYGMYKVCKIIVADNSRPDTQQKLEESSGPDTQQKLEDRLRDPLQSLLNDLSNLFAELIAHCVEECLEMLPYNTKRWAKKFNEDKITAAIEIAGFAWGVKDPEECNEASARTSVAHTALVIL
ncbi:hypothetical protein SUGI_0094530 [Cryptomeria japonica]|nr:hypothetical protein SUGI_0094530 [Cryptomeria japonica]